MRVLVTTPPGLGHVNPTVPLARAIQRRGHEVLWATGADAHDWVHDAGLPGVNAGLSSGEAAQEFWRRNADARTLPRNQIPDLMFPRMFGGIAAPAMLADLLPIVRDWVPHLVVHDAAEFAGPVIASMVGVPSVTKSFGALIPRHRVEAAEETVAPMWQSLGLEQPAFGGCYEHLYLDVYPPGLQSPLPTYVAHSHPLRPVAYDVADGAAPAEVPLPQGSEDLPLVYLTMGTAFNDATVLRQIVEAMATLRIRLLVTVGPRGNPADMGDQPSNVRVERYVPQTLVLPRCQVVISHGGSGTMLAALALGLPQLCLPQGADQFGNAAAIAGAGAGLALVPDEAMGPTGAHAIASATTRLLEDVTFSDCAMKYSEIIASMPGPDEVAARLEHLAGHTA